MPTDSKYPEEVSKVSRMWVPMQERSLFVAYGLNIIKWGIAEYCNNNIIIIYFLMGFMKWCMGYR